MSEGKCQRCGEMGHDRRTLFMDCFYQMNELRIPFSQMAITGKRNDMTGQETLPKFNVKVPIWSEPLGDEHRWSFYTLRVCKDCRASWMHAIKNWFDNPPACEQETGTGVYVRDCGTNRELTEREIAERWPNVEKP